MALRGDCISVETDVKVLATKLAAFYQEYKKSEGMIEKAKDAVDKHFDISNNLQAKMDKMSQKYVTKDDVAAMIQLAKTEILLSIRERNENRIMVIGLLLSVFVLVIGLVYKLVFE